MGKAIYNVIDYGPWMNGTSDDATVLNNLIATVGAAGGGVISFPPGNFLIKSRLSVAYNNITFRGSGKSATTIKRDDSMNDRMVDLVSAVNITFRDLGFDTNGGAPGYSSGYATDGAHIAAIQADVSSHNLTVEGCAFLNSRGFSFYVFNGPTTRVNNLRLLYNDFLVLQSSSVGADNITAGCEGGILLGNWVYSGAGVGLLAYEANHLPMVGNTVVGNGYGTDAFSVSSSWCCPVVGNAALLGSDDYGVQIDTEIDNISGTPASRQSKDVLVLANALSNNPNQTSLSTDNWQGIKVWDVLHGMIVANLVDDANHAPPASSSHCQVALHFTHNALDPNYPDYVLAVSNQLTNAHSVLLEDVGDAPTHKTYRNNAGYNPVGQPTLAAPWTLPYTPAASPATLTNSYGSLMQVWVTGGTGVSVTVGSTATGLGTGLFAVPPNETISITFTTAPTIYCYQM